MIITIGDEIMAKNMFDLDDELLNDNKNKYEEELKKANILCIRERYDKALEIYNQILDEDMENEDAYIGLLRAHSKNFSVFDGEEIERDIRVIEKLFPDIMNEEYVNYYTKRKKSLENTPKEPEIKKDEKIIVDSSRDIPFIKPIQIDLGNDYTEGINLFNSGIRNKNKISLLEAKKYLEPLLYTGNPEIFYRVGKIYLETLNDKYDDHVFNALNLFKYVTKYHNDIYSINYARSCYEAGYIYYFYMNDKSMALEYFKGVSDHARPDEHVIAEGLIGIITYDNNPQMSYDYFNRFDMYFGGSRPLDDPKLEKYLLSECYYRFGLLEMKYGNKEVAKMYLETSKQNGNADASRRLALM